MGRYLNSKVPFERYKRTAGAQYFVDKTSLLTDVINSAIMDGQKYLCITRPPHFGKTVMAGMVGAFLGKAWDSSSVFDWLAVAGDQNYKAHLNQYNVVFIDFGGIRENFNSYKQYMNHIRNGINQDLVEAYPEAGVKISGAVWDNFRAVFERTGERFVFIMDEWDAVFHMDFVSVENRQEYLMFIRSLLKDRGYVEFAYMTGVLPIVNDSGRLPLNMFMEYDMTVMERYSDGFGFVEEEVDRLFGHYLKITEKPKITRKDLRMWYGGYHTAMGENVYNPHSVVCALSDNKLINDRTGSGLCGSCCQGKDDELPYWFDSYKKIVSCVKNNIDDIRGDLIRMMDGEGIGVRFQNHAAVFMELNTKDKIYSAMVTYGLLTYMDGEVFIPNKELKNKIGKYFS